MITAPKLSQIANKYLYHYDLLRTKNYSHAKLCNMVINVVIDEIIEESILSVDENTTIEIKTLLKSFYHLGIINKTYLIE